TAGVRSLIFSVDAEPTTHLVDEAAAMARRQGCDLVIAVGGGSVIDTRMAVIDPELSRSLPPEVTAYTGMDALTQLIEPFVSHAANPLTDGVCREGLALAARSLAVAFHDGADLAARQDMCAAALFSGIALANAKLGAVHGLAGVLGGTTGH